MNPSVDFRPMLAAGLLLAVLAGSYETARRLPPKAMATQPVVSVPVTDTTAVAGVAVTPPPAPSIPPVLEVEPSATADWEFRRSQQPAEQPRRYVGTVGGELATALLSRDRTDSARGCFYRWRQAGDFTLRLARRQAGPGWRVQAENGPPYPQGRWLLSAPPDTTLRGVWITPAGRRLPFALRESYQGTVRYELIEETYTSPRYEQGGSQYSCTFLHLLGAAPSRRPLSRLQWPGPAARRRYVLADHETGDKWYHSLDVALNDFNLLSYSTFEYTNPFRGTVGRGNDGTFLFDLATGRELTLASQLRPGYEKPLRQLLTQRFLHDPEQQARNKADGLTWDFDSPDDDPLPGLASLPDPHEGCLFEPSGLRLSLYENELVRDGYYAYRRSVLIPYAELRPLVRPGTPLARMLRARGLW